MKVINTKLYCEECNKYYEVPVVLSASSFMIERDANLKKRFEEGTLFKNFCPVCGKELIDKKED